LGGAGEALFFAGLFLAGILAVTELLLLRSFSGWPGFLTSGWGLWLGILGLASLIVLGAIGLIYTVMVTGTSAERRAAIKKRAAGIDLLAEAQPSPKAYPNVPRDANWTNSPGIRLAYRLPISGSPAWRLLLVATFCLIWNGAVAVLAVLALNGAGGARRDWGYLVLVLLFAAFGAVVLFYMFRLLLVATAIGPTGVEISAQPLFPGNQYQVYLTQAGHFAIRWIELLLVCEEEVSFTQGTDTRSEACRVYERRVFRRENFHVLPGAPFEEESILRLPPDAHHSFLSGHNALHWKLIVRAEPTQWPTYERTFPIVVYPLSAALQKPA
jgi:hypothetical protein